MSVYICNTACQIWDSALGSYLYPLNLVGKISLCYELCFIYCSATRFPHSPEPYSAYGQYLNYLSTLEKNNHLMITCERAGNKMRVK